MNEIEEPEEEDAPGGEATAAGELPPYVRPPGRLAAGAYRALHAGIRTHNPADHTVLAATAVLLLCSAWHAILLLTPAVPAV